MVDAWRKPSRGSDGHGSLAEAALALWGKRCPCCSKPFRRRRIKHGAPQTRDTRTVGHDTAVGRGGDPNVYVYICAGCNNDQGWHDFASWARLLAHAGDARAARVAEVAALIVNWRRKAA